MPDYSYLLQFAITERQRQYIEAIIQHGSERKAAQACDVSKNSVRQVLEACKKRAAMAGIAPENDLHYPLPSGQQIRGVSTLIDKTTGQSRLQWVKTTVSDGEREAAMVAAVEALTAGLPKYEPTSAPTGNLGQLLTLYTLTDVHVGARAWARETGADWDLDIAERVVTGAMQQLIASSPPAAIGFINQLGDFLHADGLNAVTPTSGHLLDVDGRYPKVVEVAVRILRRVINMALERHDQVFVMIAEGNHDMASSVWLRHLFALLYENEPRIKVIDSVTPYHAHKHGNTMLAFHHGHMRKNDQLPMLFAAQYPQVWGSTGKRYCHTGHRHHVEEKEHSGMTVVQHPTIAARDAYASRGGWLSERSLTSITYHEQYGQVARATVVPEMVQ